MYVDDTHLTFASNDVAHLEKYMNDDLTKITEWLTAKNGLLISQKASLCCWFKAKVKYFNTLPSFTIDSNSIITYH